MKKISTFVIALLLGAGLSLAQTGGDKSSLNPQPLPPGKKATAQSTKTKGKAKKKTMTTASHKGGKKIPPAAATTTKSGGTTPPPK